MQIFFCAFVSLLFPFSVIVNGFHKYVSKLDNLFFLTFPFLVLLLFQHIVHSMKDPSIAAFWLFTMPQIVGGFEYDDDVKNKIWWQYKVSGVFCFPQAFFFFSQFHDCLSKTSITLYI